MVTVVIEAITVVEALSCLSGHRRSSIAIIGVRAAKPSDVRGRGRTRHHITTAIGSYLYLGRALPCGAGGNLDMPRKLVFSLALYLENSSAGDM